MRDFLSKHSLSVALGLGFLATLIFSLIAHAITHELWWKWAGDAANNILSEWFALFIMVEFTKVFHEAGSAESKHDKSESDANKTND